MKKQHLRVLKQIQESIPTELLKSLIIKVPQFPTLKEVAQHAIVDPSIPEEEKEQMRALLASGYLDKMIDATDADIEKQIDELLSNGIKQAVEDGLLPKKINNPKLKKKSKKYVKRQIEKGSN